MMKYVLAGVVGGIVVGVLVDRIVLQLQENKRIERTKILEKCFGAPMYTSVFSMNEARDWIKVREEKLKSGAKAVILKATAETLQNIGKDLDIGTGIENNIVLAIVNQTTKDIEDSVLIRYETLDNALESALEKGKGILVVEA